MRTIVKNTVFESASNQQLSLTLDQQFANLLTKQSELTIQTALQKHFGILSLTITTKKPSTQTLAQKETQENQQKVIKLQKTFLNNKGVQALQKAFNARIEPESIQEINPN